MGQNSNIEWTHHTFNPWRGCTKVSAGCANCYADTLSKRNPKALGIWGPRGSRVVAAESYWREPLKWNKSAQAAGERHRVFCASLADVFEGEDTMPAESRQSVHDARIRLFDVIHQTPNLDWLLLTKRPENIIPIIGGESGAGLTFFREHCPNVWLGTSVEDQQNAEKRIPELLECRDLAAVLFLSMEPLIDAVELTRWVARDRFYMTLCEHCKWIGSSECCDGQDDDIVCPACHRSICGHHVGGIDWVIVGGESGPGARPMHPDWVRSIRDQCQAAGVPFFFKQWGEFSPDAECPVDPRRWSVVEPTGRVRTGTTLSAAELNSAVAAGSWAMARVGKKAAGRLLDGREWSEFPAMKAHGLAVGLGAAHEKAGG